ncbi:MAG TPA: amidohydrolase [Bacilli bacterium]|nr:amidohydrolase [Bacilli bacterium]
MKTLLKNARILKMNGAPLFQGDIVIENNIIVYIGPSGDSFSPFDVVYDCHGNILMPGFKNAHSHSAMTFLRSKTDGYSLHDWLFDVVFPREELLKPSDVYHLSKVAYLEYLTSGITACFDQYYFPLMSGQAAKDIGMRILLLGTFNHETSAEDLVNFYNQFNEEKDSLVRYCFGMHAEYTAKSEEFEALKAAIHIAKAPFYVHICETKSEVEDCYQRRGMSPVAFFEKEGFFDYGGGGYHCIYFNDQDVEIFRKHNLSIVSCPGSNAKLASGIIPFEKYRHANINIALGTDGPASNNCLDMFKEMTLAFSLSKLTNQDPCSLPAYDVLKMATVNGAKAMGLSDCDILEIGKKADIIEINLSRPNMQPLNDIINNIVFSGSKENIKMTMIDGKILYLDGQLSVGEPVESIYQKCQEITDRIEKELAKSKK